MEDQGATKEELTAMVDQKENMRDESQESFLALRQNLVNLSDESDWPKLSKALGKLIN